MNTALYLIFLALFAITSAVPLILHEVDQEEQYELTPVLSRQRREPQWSATGGGNSRQQNVNLGYQNPNGSGGQLGYGHARGYGHDVSVDAMVPVWSRKTGRGESTLNLGGGVSQHFGGPSGSHMTDKRIGATFIHKF